MTASATSWSHEQLLAGHYTAEQVDVSCRLAHLCAEVLADSDEDLLAEYDRVAATAKRVCSYSLPFLLAQHRGCHGGAA